MLSEISDTLLDPSDPEYHSDDYRQYLKVLEWRVRNVQMNGSELTSNTNEVNSAKTTKLYQLAVLIYITRTSENSTDQSEKIIEWVAEGFTIMSQLNTCKAPFPLFAFGCEARNDEMRTVVLNLICATEREAHIQSLERVKSMLEFIWVQNDLVNVRMDYTDQLSRIFGLSDILPAMF